MENLKIKCKTKKHGEQAQELFFSLGYGFEDCKNKNIQELEYVSDFYLFAYSDGDLTHSCAYGVFMNKAHKEITLQELRDMVNQDQDEPFLTPESLNDQYAEIERVRKQTIEATLAERQAQYGCFEDVAFVTENIMATLSKVRSNGLTDLPHTHRMALYMIASKMARIVNGDFNSIDEWHNIGGYSKLIEDLL